MSKYTRPLRIAGVGAVLLVTAYLVSMTSLSIAKDADISSEISKPRIGAQADRLLREMSEYLQSAKEFTFHSDITYDEMLSSGQMIQYGGTNTVSVRRPNRLHAAFNGDERKSRTFYDGRTITIFDAILNIYAVTKVPRKIDSAVDAIFEKYGFSVPIADLVYSDPYAILTQEVQSGFLVGQHAVDGIKCNHLAFSQENIDWQIWIQDGPRPVPRKLLITYKNEPGCPQYTARLSGWDFKPHLSDHSFTFHAPEGADEIEFLPIGNRGGDQ